jgi:hypothetical protein
VFVAFWGVAVLVLYAGLKVWFRFGGGTVRVGFQNSATVPELGFYAARSYSLMRPPRTGRRWIRFRVRSATG